MSLRDRVRWPSKMSRLYVFGIFASFQRCQRRQRRIGHFPDVGLRRPSLAVAGCCGLSWAFVVVWELVGAGETHQRVTTTRWWWWEVDRANGGGRNPEKLTNESS